MKQKFWIVCLTVGMLGISLPLFGGANKDTSDLQSISVAICPYLDRSIDDNKEAKKCLKLGNALSEMLISDIVKIKGVWVKERFQVEPLIKELDINDLGLTDEQERLEKNKVTGTDIILWLRFKQEKGYNFILLQAQDVASRRMEELGKITVAGKDIYWIEKEIAGIAEEKFEKLTKGKSEYIKSKVKPANLCIAIMPLTNYTGKERLNYMQEGFADILTEKLMGTNSIKVVEREKIDKVLKEIELTLSGVIESKERVKIGQLLGANRMIIGSFTQSGNILRLDCRMIEVETGNIEWVESVAAKTDDFYEILGSITLSLIKHLDIALNKEQKTIVKAVDTRSLEAVIHYYHGLEANRLGRYKESLEIFNKCIYVDSNFYKPYFYLGLAHHLGSPNQQKCIDFYTKYVRLGKKGALIVGRVRGEGGEKLSTIALEASYHRASSARDIDKQGRYCFLIKPKYGRLRQGGVEIAKISYQKKGYLDVFKEIKYRSGDIISLNDVIMKKTEKSGSIRGKVTSEGLRTGEAYIQVLFGNVGYSGGVDVFKTELNGTYFLKSLPPGEYQLRFFKEYYAYQNVRHIVAKSGEIANVQETCLYRTRKMKFRWCFLKGDTRDFTIEDNDIKKEGISILYSTNGYAREKSYVDFSKEAKIISGTYGKNDFCFKQWCWNGSNRLCLDQGTGFEEYEFGIMNMGSIPLKGIRIAPKHGYKHSVPAIAGNSYVIKCWDGYFAKIRIEDIQIANESDSVYEDMGWFEKLKIFSKDFQSNLSN